MSYFLSASLRSRWQVFPPGRRTFIGIPDKDVMELAALVAQYSLSPGTSATCVACQKKGLSYVCASKSGVGKGTK